MAPPSLVMQLLDPASSPLSGDGSRAASSSGNSGHAASSSSDGCHAASSSSLDYAASLAAGSPPPLDLASSRRYGGQATSSSGSVLCLLTRARSPAADSTPSLADDGIVLGACGGREGRVRGEERMRGERGKRREGRGIFVIS